MENFQIPVFRQPEAQFWPGYFWMWNSELDPELLKEQLRDMASHDAKSVCMIPMPRAFRPDSTNNSMNPDYLTEGYFERVRIAVDEAAKQGMKWWLYDEGGWPSGQALGHVVEGHPEFQRQRVTRERIETREPFVVPPDALALVTGDVSAIVVRPGDTWVPSHTDSSAYVYRVVGVRSADTLNPEATKRFITLTHEGYRHAIAEHFGKTVHFAFTDEPSSPNPDPPKSIPWTPGLDKLHDARGGGSLFHLLPLLFVEPSRSMGLPEAQARVDFYELWTSRFRDAYFQPLLDWGRKNNVLSGGHLNGEDETLNAVRHGYGHALRQLRTMDVPGVDVIWRQLFPGKPNQHHFPKYASSSAHQNGTRYAFSESFAVYGNGLTPAQMKWIVDYQYVRGINLLVIGCYPLSTRDHHMTGERPHFGPMNPLWDHMPGFHAYVARLGYAMSVGSPKISAALYYPARDMWAWGLGATEAAETHDQLAMELFANQCDFDLIDDDLIAAAPVEDGKLIAGAMRYSTIVCGAVCWMRPDALAKLTSFAAAGGTVLCVGHAPGTNGTPGLNDPGIYKIGAPDTLARHFPKTVRLSPPSRDVRCAVRNAPDGEIVMLFNEGERPFNGVIAVETSLAYLLDPQTGRISELPLQDGGTAIHLVAGETALLLLTSKAQEAAPQNSFSEEHRLRLDGLIVAHPRRRFVVGEHDFEIVVPGSTPISLERGRAWREWLGADYSGEVDYRITFDLPESWAHTPLLLETGPIEYAATVLLDGVPVGHMLWPPWCITLPPCNAGKHELVIRVANTLANELTSERVTQLWASKSGPGGQAPTMCVP